ncbi:hypothetical protein [Thioalkalivibrio sp. ALJ2]|uniref:hypothetical protein n=1 Tax=Thioalkalivibrio sp. ALJ2 TaxID=1261622 RepID=UPI0012DD09A4|nr:hypothetical protein [Thioalkalivibrio sp. ALJ2]
MDGLDNARLPEIHVPESVVPKRFGSYQLRVIEEGHIPRTLSGMRGTAPEFGAGYAKSRSAVEDWARETYGIRAEKVLINGRWTKVWTDSTGNVPIRLRIVMKEKDEEGA